jgi:hypothetical protein
MPFKIPNTPSVSTESPEALFRDLRNRSIQGLLSHQADILREYVDKALNDTDVAFELPTGSGKTLVGLLLGEWRRRKFNERIVYLCPTNQLVNQVVDQASNYGIKVHGFTGSKNEYDPSAKSEYMNCETIAITSYSALFNSHPYFTNPQLIILDDAHSADNYISAMWTIRVERFKDEHKTLFTVLSSILKEVMPPTDYLKLTEKDIDSAWDYSWVEKIPTTDFYKIIPKITEVFNANIGNLDIRFPWELLHDHLEACHCYVSRTEILIRPLIPLGNRHAPFNNAKQRIYMSATLGEGGELERITGRKNIKRLQIQSGWDKQGVGRRLFFFPNRSLDEDKSQSLVINMIKRSKRALIIVSDNRRSEEVNEMVSSSLRFKTFNAKEIEKSKSIFTTENQAVAIVANRYDGIDFINDECRLLILGGLPRATNLQEKFIIQKMGSVALLNDRILTRIQQAFGRCTRSSTDFAAVVVWDDELHNYLLTKEHRLYLHPEIQAELEFGIDQSKNGKYEDYLEYLDIFLNHNEEWDNADNYIATLRQSMSKATLPGTNDLNRSVAFELEYQYALWEGDYLQALENCRKILATLTDESLKGYRALWNYLAGSAVWLATQKGLIDADYQAREYFENAKKAAPTISWLIRVSKADAPSKEHKSNYDKEPILIERIETILESLGTINDLKYAKREKNILDLINKNEAKSFEEGQKILGEFLGYDAGNENTDGAPDPWWLIDQDLCIVFEDYSDASPDSDLPISKARQAALHQNWIKNKLSLSPSAKIITIIVSSVKTIDKEAVPFLGDVYFWDIGLFREWVLKSLTVIRELRTNFPGSGDLVWRADAISKYKANKLDPEGILSILKLANKLPTK